MLRVFGATMWGRREEARLRAGTRNLIHGTVRPQRPFRPMSHFPRHFARYPECMSTILDEIVAAKRVTIEAAKAERSEADLERAIANLPPTRDFTAAVGQPGHVNVIAEVKKASPSAGIIREDFNPVLIATAYEEHGAAAISVLTDEPFFQGRLKYLTAIHAAVAVPVLRKDFILERYQLLEVRAAADAALLIAECLPGDELAKLQRAADEIGLHTLVELHDADQLPRVLNCGEGDRHQQPRLVHVRDAAGTHDRIGGKDP